MISRTSFIGILLFSIMSIINVWTASAQSNDKVVLIIGNDKYEGEHFRPLTTCINDAKEIERCFQRLGYRTILLTDATRQEMSDAFKEFNKIIRTNNTTVGVFYYSGHAVTIEDSQYLVPARTSITESYLKNDCIDMTQIRDDLKRHCRYSFIFHDACRTEHESKGDQKGGWTSTDDSQVGTENEHLTLYATSRGKVAYSGEGRLSPFTEILCRHLFDRESFLKVWTRYISVEVEQLANQKPMSESWFYSGFVFNSKGVKSIYDDEQTNDRIKVKFNVYPKANIRFSDKEYESGSTLSFVRGKEYVYTVTLDGYEMYTGKFTADNSVPSVIDINLKKESPASMWVYGTKPKSLTVYVDDKYAGRTPCKISTTSGRHLISFRSNNFYSETQTVELKPGQNDPMYVSLSRRIPEYFDYNTTGSAALIRYHYSPQFQIGFSRMYDLEDVPVSLGYMFALSPAIFRGWKGGNSGMPVDYTEHVTFEDAQGNIIPATKHLASLNTNDVKKYSALVDPYNEAQARKSNLLMLANVGFNPMNGLALEFGCGAARLQDRYHMENTYLYTVTSITNDLTGEYISSPVTEYRPSSKISKWYVGDVNWTFAMRFGGRVLIPLDGFDQWSLTLGGGYIYMPFQHKYSTWDASIGIQLYY